MNLLTQNRKMKKSKDKRTFNFGIPAYKDKVGNKTCPNAAACIVGCYANAGAYMFSNVKSAFEARLKATKQNNFAELIQLELDKKRVERLRIHDSGDFYSLEYTMKWFEVMKANPSIHFYAYTKMVSMFKVLTLAGHIPSNFTLIYSFGGTQDKLIDKNTDRHSMVFETHKERKIAKYSNTTEDDRHAVGLNIRVGLVYHGAKLYKNTTWNKVIVK